MTDNISSIGMIDTICFNLDQIKNWEFNYKKKTYKLNVKELIKLLKEIKKLK